MLRKTISTMTVITLFSTTLSSIVATAEEGNEHETTVLSKKVTVQAKEPDSNEIKQSSEKIIEGQEARADLDSYRESRLTNSNEERSTENIDDWMPDEELQFAVSVHLSMPISSITKADMLKLSTLEYQNKKIVNLTGLEYATNLTSINLTGNQISDLSPLKNLTNLSQLTLDTNQISDLSPLQNLTNLDQLGLSSNLVSDLSPLQNLTNLTMLNIRSNQVSDLSPLSSVVGNPSSYIEARDQSVYLPVVYIPNKKPYSISIESPITGWNGVQPIHPLNNNGWVGVYNSGKVEWTGENLVSETGNLVSTWDMSQKSRFFSGTYIQPYILSKATVEAHDSTLYTSDSWNAQDNFDGAKDKDGNPVNFQDVQVTGQVDTTQAGKYKVTYSYDGVQKEIEVTVLQKVTKENSNTSNFVEDKQKENPKTSNMKEKDKALPSTGEKGSVWLLVSGVMLFIFASGISLLRFKKNKQRNIKE